MSNQLLETFTEVQSIFLVGRRWFERTNGNTYHTVEIYVNDEFVHKIPMTYGYGDQYIWNGFAYVADKYKLMARMGPGLLIAQGDKLSTPSAFCRENNIKFNYTVSDVARKRDL